MHYAVIAIGASAAYVSAFLLFVRFQVTYIATKHGLVRHRFERFHCCESFLKTVFAPIIFLHFLVRRRFCLESRLPEMQSADPDRAAMLPVARQIGLSGGLAIWKNDLVSISFMRRPITDHQLSIVGTFTPVVDLDLSHTSVTDVGMQHLNQLRNLQTVDLTNTWVTDAGVSILRDSLPGVIVWRRK